jgi:hypothetical protein
MILSSSIHFDVEDALSKKQSRQNQRSTSQKYERRDEPMASMILTGMGPVDRMESTDGKLFATFYAIYSGLAFLSMVAIIIAPVYHRFLHHFHLDDE